MHSTEQERILFVDPNPLFLKRLTWDLRARSLDVFATESGAQAFHVLRDYTRHIDWLFTRTGLPGLIDGRILADEYHDGHPTRAAVIADLQARVSVQRHIVLKDPSRAAVLDTMRCIMAQHQASETLNHFERDEEQLGA
jgi:CheY-like chemotaxis protein